MSTLVEDIKAILGYSDPPIPLETKDKVTYFTLELFPRFFVSNSRKGNGNHPFMFAVDYDGDGHNMKFIEVAELIEVSPEICELIRLLKCKYVDDYITRKEAEKIRLENKRKNRIEEVRKILEVVQ